ncbi:bifunctional alpha/beta hydrolase/OsmC family protein [Algoriphagus taiwanensis]|uniref:Bifunctional alpha/beta hydrolase/OsmC family protein n=1 Tax=Algoriphagus taiwanensis TaxID=1445656 RepID=A0ABQ6Q4E4_9BACT|nr:bifunctional alpha/beta hydrolase/OsmC family protein [Algoriphagus taiwanensis]
MKTQNLTFPNASGEQLSAKLYLPLDEHPRYFALFAHCFTCSKNFKAVSTISDTLSQLGVAVFSFDFTGLGNSEGEFSTSGFSSNVSDLMAASRFLEQNYSAPKLLIGHSLGGAAVIFAAAKLDTVEALVTIGAPSSPEHVKHLFSEELDEIEEKGNAKVNIGGRPFTLSQEFVEDLESQNLEEVLHDMRKALLILHSPQDLIVEIANAAELYQAAHHPKSFVSLNGADHLLSDAEESSYAAEVISAWSKKYLPHSRPENDVKGHQVKVRLAGDNYTTEVLTPFHHLIADEPESDGGRNLGPTPYDLLMASLGTCTAMTLKMYSERKGWKWKEVVVYLNHEKVHQEDSAGVGKNKGGKISKFTRWIEIQTEELTDEMKEKALEIADKCPVHKTLHEPIEVETRFREPES